MTQRNLRSKSLRISLHERGLQTPESSLHSQSEVVEGNDSSDKTPTQQAKVPVSRKRVAARPSRPAKKRKRNQIYDDPEAILGGEDSPLFGESVNIKNIILHPKALAILGSITSQYQALESDTLSTAVAAFKEDGACGHFDPDWIRKSTAASKFRSSGHTAEFEEHIFNETWHSENEVLSDDENAFQPLQHNGNIAKDGDCRSFSEDNIKDTRNGKICTDNADGPPNDEIRDEIGLVIGLDNQKQPEDDMRN